MDNNIKEKLGTAYKIFINANESYLFAKYFDTATNDIEKKVIQKSSIRFIQHALLRNAIIELAKLFTIGENSHFSLYNIRTYIQKNNSNMPNVIDSQTLKKWKSMLKNIQPLTKQIIDLRNKFYAHTDSDRNDYLVNIDLSYKIIEEILLNTFQLLDDIYMKTLDTNILMRNIYFKNVDIVQILAENHENSRNERVNIILNKNI